MSYANTNAITTIKGDTLISTWSNLHSNKIVQYGNEGFANTGIFIKTHSIYFEPKAVSVFVSFPIKNSSKYNRWKELLIEYTTFANNYLKLFIRSSNSMDGILKASWTEKHIVNKAVELDKVTDEYFQFRIEMYTMSQEKPFVTSVNLAFFLTDTKVTFSTMPFHVRAVPRHVLLTYNGSFNKDVQVDFYIASIDDLNNATTRMIQTNKIEETPLSKSELVKVIAEITGSSDEEFSLDEFALIIG